MQDYGITENLWVWLVIGGPVLLGVLIAFAMFRRRSISPAEHRATERATRELYDPEDRGKPVDRVNH